MRFIILFLSLCIFSAKTTAQIVFKIEELVVAHTHHDISNGRFFTSDDWMGPSVLAKCFIINNTDSIIVFETTIKSISFLFKYDSMDYKSGYFTFLESSFSIGDTLLKPEFNNFGEEYFRPIQQILNPNDTIDLVFGTCIFITTDIADKDYGIHYDFRNEMIEILPTLKVMYRDENIEICTDEILNVRHILPQKYPKE